MSRPAALRPDWWSVRRRHVSIRPEAHAATDAPCPRCTNEVLRFEPIVCVGSAVDAAPDGARTVDLSGASWVCQTCGVAIHRRAAA